jgi:YD repeat-containing protein
MAPSSPTLTIPSRACLARHSRTLNTHQYSYNTASQRTQQVFTAGDYVNYTYYNIGQLQTARGKESGGATNRLHEQLGYFYNAAGNLSRRTNNVLIATFNVNGLNELTTAANAGTLTVAGTTTSQATNVTVNGLAASLYGDYTFAKDGFTVTNGNNSFTAIAKDHYGRSDTNVSTSYLPSPVCYTCVQASVLTFDTFQQRPEGEAETLKAEGPYRQVEMGKAVVKLIRMYHT